MYKPQYAVQQIVLNFKSAVKLTAVVWDIVVVKCCEK